MKTQVLDNPSNPHTWTKCIAVRGDNSIIDIINPGTGLTQCYKKTLADCQKDYPKAEVMSVAEFCQDKASKQDSPIEWRETTEERYWEMLEVLPPAFMGGGAFLVGEPWDHHALTGQPRYSAFIQRDGKFLEASRPITVKELKAVLADRFASVAA